MLLSGELNRLRWFVRHFTIQKYLKNNPEPKLHLGSGGKIIEGWLNGDKFNPKADIYLNVYDKLPFKKNSIKNIFLEHLIEHIKVDKIPFFLSEMYRILKPGGVVRITCPDLEIFVKMYYEDNKKFFEPLLLKYKEQMKQNKKKYWLVKTKGGILNSRVVSRFYHHRWFYDFETLSACLKDTGFKKIIKQKYRKSLIKEVERMDAPKKEKESLYIDAVKGQ